MPLGLCAPPVAQARETPRWAGVNQAGELTSVVWACNVASQRGAVRLVDADQNVLYEQFSAATNFGKRLNLRRLPDGRCAFVVTIGPDVHRFDVQLSSTRQRQAELGNDQLLARPRAGSVAALAPGAAH